MMFVCCDTEDDGCFAESDDVIIKESDKMYNTSGDLRQLYDYLKR